MIKILTAIVLFIGLSFPAFAADEKSETAYERVIRTGTLRCGVMIWPPFFEIDPNSGKIQGLGVGLFGVIGDLLDLEVEYKEIVVGQQAEDLKSGKIDAVCNDGPYVFSAMKFVDYSTPIYFGPAYVYARADDKRFHDFTGLDDPAVTFAGMDGDFSIDLARRKYPKAKVFSLPATSDAASLMMSVATGKADLVIIDKTAVDSFNTTNQPGLREITGTYKPMAIYPIGLSVAKGQQDLLNMLNAGINAGFNTDSFSGHLKTYNPDGKVFLSPARPYEAPRP